MLRPAGVPGHPFVTIRTGEIVQIGFVAKTQLLGRQGTKGNQPGASIRVVGIEGKGLVKLVTSFRASAGVAQGAGAGRTQVRAAGIKLHRSVEGAQRLLRLSFSCANACQTGPMIRVLRRDFEDGQVCLLCFCEPARPGQHASPPSFQVQITRRARDFLIQPAHCGRPIMCVAVFAHLRLPVRLLFLGRGMDGEQS